MAFIVSAVVLWTFGFAAVKIADHVTDGLVSSELAERQVAVHLGYVTFSTRCLNRPIEYVARRHRRFLQLWFTVGVVLGFCGLVLSMFMLSNALVSAIAAGLAFETQTDAGMGPLLPETAATVLGGPLTGGEAGQSGSFVPQPPLLSLNRIFGLSEHGAVRNVLRWQRDHHLRPDRRWHHWGVKRERSSQPAVGPDDPPRGLNPSDPSLRRSHRGTDFVIDSELHGRPHAVHRRGLAAAIDDSSAHSAAVSAIVVHGHEQLGPVLETEHYSSSGSAATSAFVDGPRQEGSIEGHGPSLESVRHDMQGVPQQPNSAGFLTPLLPGVTVPMTDMSYIAVAMLVSAMVHEIGHAMAASMQEAKVESFGGFLAFLFPGAFVRLTGVNALPPFRQLKVWCAGAWHNFVLAVICLGLISVLPLAVSGLYGRGVGAQVVSLPDGSPLATHVQPGDVILGFGRFRVEDGAKSFRSATSRLVETGDSAGFCLSEKLFQDHAHSASECCDLVALGKEHSRLQCFSVTDGVHIGQKLSCISPVVASTRPTCRSSSDCTPSSPSGAGPLDEADAGIGVASPEICFLAVLPQRQKLIDIRVRSGQTGKVNHFLFQGYPEVLAQSVSVSSYVIRHTWALPWSLTKLLASVDAPNVLERQLQYVVSISLALAILNMAPVYRLDGEASASLFIKLLVPGIDSFRLAKISGILLNFGSSLLALNILLALLD
jgi:S2P endopeptidase